VSFRKHTNKEPNVTRFKRLHARHPDLDAALTVAFVVAVIATAESLIEVFVTAAGF
jgi:hypothetical protein